MARTDLGLDEVLQLWVRYCEFQSKHLSASTMKRDYDRITKRLCKMPDLATSASIRDWLLQHYAADTTRRTLEKLSACCDWAVRSRFIPVDPFAPLLKDFRKTSRGDRRAFTAPERDAIINAFATDTYLKPCSPVPHSYYSGFIQLLFYTGCRLEEARVLRWSHVARDYSFIRFERAMPSDTNIEGPTKTHRNRVFPCNERLSRVLRSAPSGDGLVFPAPQGGAIDTHNLLNRGWAEVVGGLVEAGPVRERLPLKNVRHTFITLALDAGMDAKDIAYLVGNSADVIYKHYASVKRNLQVPEF